MASAQAVRSFDLSRLPLIRVHLFKLAQTEHVLLLNLHHIIADGVSVGLLLNDVRLLSDRVGKLQSHLGQADGDIKNILISAGKVTNRAERIEHVDLAPTESVPPPQLVARQA